MRARRTANLVPALLALTALALGGCGSSSNGVASKSATEILAASKAAAESASSVHASGESSESLLKLSIDLELSRDAGRGALSLLGLQFEAIRDGEALYLKGDPTFYSRLGIDPAKVPSGAWVKAPASSSQIGQLLDFEGETSRLLTSPQSTTKGSTTTIEGQPAIELKIKGRLYTGSLYIATTGQPYPLKIEKHGRETSHVTFTGWNKPVSVSAPANTVDISQVG